MLAPRAREARPAPRARGRSLSRRAGSRRAVGPWPARPPTRPDERQAPRSHLLICPCVGSITRESATGRAPVSPRTGVCAVLHCVAPEHKLTMLGVRCQASLRNVVFKVILQRRFGPVPGTLRTSAVLCCSPMLWGTVEVVYGPCKNSSSSVPVSPPLTAYRCAGVRCTEGTLLTLIIGMILMHGPSEGPGE